MMKKLRAEKHRTKSHGCDYQAKVRYPTYNIARTVAARVGRDIGIALKVYKCPACKMYHLTSRVAP